MANRRIKTSAGSKLSNLPDELIHYIFAFLSLNDISRMRAVPRRCRSPPVISFSLNKGERFHCEKRIFFRKKHINQLLAERINHGIPVQDFHLINTIIRNEGDLFDIHKWIVALLQCSLQKLILDIIPFKPFILPSPVLSCNTLKQVEISAVYQPLVLPSHHHFTFLEVLKLKCLQLSDGFGAWISLCTSVRSLEVFHCAGFRNFHINNSKLESFRFVGRLYGGDLDVKITATSLKTLHLEFPTTQNATVVVHTPSLRSLSWVYSGARECQWSVTKLSSLDEVDFRVTGTQDQIPPGGYESIVQFFQAVCHAKSLRINDWCMHALYRCGGHDHMTMHNLENLEMLTLLNDTKIWGMVTLLKRSPNLKNLSIVDTDRVTKLSSMSKFKDAFWESQTLEFLPQLKTVYISPFREKGNDIELVKHILEQASGMEKMTLVCQRELDLKRVLGSVHGLEITTSGCVISISPAI